MRATLPEPPRPDLPPPDPADVAACRARLRNGSRSFYAASFLLPDEIADAATSLYAFCRIVDDIVDDEARSEDAIDLLSERLHRAYAGRPASEPEDRAFAAIVSRYEVPRTLPEGLLEGMRWDAEGRRYETFSDLRAYCARVAATVGAMMAVVMGGRERATLARACDLGVAMQLSNVARDVGEDARMGRLYLPEAWLREVGLDPVAWLQAPHYCPEIGEVVTRLLGEASALYGQAIGGIAALPSSCRPGIHAARLIYAEIGREVARRGLDSVSSRAIVPNWRKCVLVFRALGVAFVPGAPSEAPPLPETRFLVDAVAADAGAAAAQEDGSLGMTLD
jgi:phytoene synthase